MIGWWKRRSLRFRLTVLYAAVASAILLALAPVVYVLIHLRLHAEFDRQLRIDLNLVEAHLEWDPEGRIRWRVRGGRGGDVYEGSAAWFEVWSADKVLLLRHWPEWEREVDLPLPPPVGAGERTFTAAFDGALPVRVIERPARLRRGNLTVRAFRDEGDMHGTLREIVIGFGLGIPLAALLAALGGYLMAGRSLAPVGAMAEQARQITSESLGRRLPNPNPHDELGRLATVFNQTLQRLQDSFDALRRFTADASHELRTPLTALRAVGEVGLRGPDDAQALRESISSMLEEAQRLNDIIDSLLLLARVEGDVSTPKLQPVPLTGLLEQARESLGILAAEKGQTIELHAEPNLIAEADPVLLRQAVLGLLHNAIRYSPAATTVTLAASPRDGRAVVDVADEGPGIDPEHHEKIFERFYRVDSARSRADGGAGLGLAIVKLLVERQGGRVEVDSEPGKGSRFRLVLAASRAADTVTLSGA